MERAIILGASRGLGAELVRYGCTHLRCPIVGFGRKASVLADLREQFPLFEYRVTDFSTHVGQDEAIRFLEGEDFSQVFCVAAGGPYGRYGETAWKNHQWAWEVSFLFHARVLHALAKSKRVQVLVVGSSVAEADVDPYAASYCSAKHAMKGLVLSLQREYPDWDLRLFSPGYMDTDLLPKNAAVRKGGVYSPAVLAHDLWQWSLTSDNGGHRVYSRHPEKLG